MAEKKFARIINNKIYDINKAVKLVTHGKDNLFRKKNGEFFLFNEEVGVILIDDNGASEWVKENASDQYDNIFNLNKFKMVSLNVTEAEYNGVAAIAESDGVSMQVVMRRALDYYINSNSDRILCK